MFEHFSKIYYAKLETSRTWEINSSIETHLQNFPNLRTCKIEFLQLIFFCLQSEELVAQKKLRQEVMQLEDVLAQLRKEYEMLRIEFEQNLAANEQTGPINREMRHLITSLQNNTQQLKGEVHRYKRKYKEANAELPKLKKEIEELTAKVSQQQTVMQESKEAVKQELLKEEENSNGESSGGAQVKDEPSTTPTAKREGDDETEVRETISNEYFLVENLCPNIYSQK